MEEDSTVATTFELPGGHTPALPRFFEEPLVQGMLMELANVVLAAKPN